MNKKELLDLLNSKHVTFINFIDSLSESEFSRSINNKWSSGQQLQHLLLSIKPISLALMIPKKILTLFLGKANRTSYTYNQITEKYQSKLNEGAKAIGIFVPKMIKFNHKGELINSINVVLKKLTSQLNKLSEKEVDTLILPHPILGKITVREMIYFTIYHVELHTEITKRNLKQS